MKIRRAKSFWLGFGLYAICLLAAYGAIFIVALIAIIGAEGIADVPAGLLSIFGFTLFFYPVGWKLLGFAKKKQERKE